MVKFICGLALGYSVAGAIWYFSASAQERHWATRCLPQESEKLAYSVQQEGFGLVCVYSTTYGHVTRKDNGK
jgi:hypothetical protein